MNYVTLSQEMQHHFTQTLHSSHAFFCCAVAACARGVYLLSLVLFVYKLLLTRYAHRICGSTAALLLSSRRAWQMIAAPLSTAALAPNTHTSKTSATAAAAAVAKSCCIKLQCAAAKGHVAVCTQRSEPARI
jgi:hypothetical protein